MAPTLTEAAMARCIGERAAAAIADIRASTTLEDVTTHHRNWTAYADAMGVAPAIRDHVQIAVNEVSIEIKARKIAADRTGERT